MKNLKNILRVLGSYGSVVAILAITILGLAVLSYGSKWLWSQFSFGFAGLCLGVMIIGITFYLKFVNSNSSEYMSSLEKDFGFNLNLFGQTGIIAGVGFFYGIAISFASVMWFFTPESIINSLPAFSSLISFSFAAGILLIASVGFVKLAVESLPVNLWGSLFMSGLLVGCLLILNYPIWSVTNQFPSNYYLIGFTLFIFLFFIQILILIFFGVLPGLQNNRRKNLEKKELVE